MATTSLLATPRLPWIRRNVISVALLVAYIAMAMLVFEQGRTIESQRTLIRQLIVDSTELAALKIKQNHERYERSQR